ncbi:phosphatidate phosphatase App1 family protein [Aspergillus clavatus NRRL 1]|uniref:Phosphatidate phosphatase APP1 catalytic domain-containing protein n=1 Tax=Aspergillus clavatus (strain ATCC 1007 / CBS 513.65 / DSM 816 / NCTC 3887 / NRRL 1 / QM 1276 / 107) TaxID=344612 RepID=A1CQZ6_ASPCL|nr:uncharacterized protein ACLA_027920 [Aspergillus clavatus NRRL 1]EAW08067.1 conserved hypothetical protein [Aspergillus clavatus NRRL 1]
MDDKTLVVKAQEQGPRPRTRKKLRIKRIISSILWKQASLHIANSRQHTVWLFDNTAYQRVVPKALGQGRPAWRMEVVACVFEKDSRKDISKFVATIADLIGLDGEIGTERETRHQITRRLRPFLYQTAPAYKMTIEIPLSDDSLQLRELGPTDSNGLISQNVNLGTRQLTDGARIRSYLRGWEGEVSMDIVFAGQEGWILISDIDDTIKYTKTSEATGILRTTFVEAARPIRGMPQLYAHIQKHIVPTWFYLSASPYNLYPFLREFLHTYFTPGTLMLRESSWMDVSSLIRSFTTYTMEYKVNNMEKLHRSFPRRQALCIGDSTQKDPEAYAEIYRRHPNWVKAILIRKVTDVPHMEEQNSPERFRVAFKDVPDSVWTVFEEPEEVYKLVDRLT